MKIVHETNDFRIYQTELVKGINGKLIKMTLCEFLLRGWEPFYSLAKVIK